MKKLLSLFFVFVAIGLSEAQTTSVTATITDSSGQAWIGGTYRIDLITPRPGNYTLNGNPFPQHYPVSALNSSGALSATLADNTIIRPLGTQWRFTICPNATSSCGIIGVVVSGPLMNLSTTLSNAVPLPRVSAAPTYSKAYKEDEVVTLSGTPINSQAAAFYDTTVNCVKIYSGSSWSCLGTGTGSGMVWPAGAGVASCTGTPCNAWTASYEVGTNPNDLVQLNSSGQLPAVSGALLTGLPSGMVWPATPGVPTCTGTPCTAYGTTIGWDSGTSTLTGNISGNANTATTAGNLSGTPDLNNGITATTQVSSDNSTKLATTAYVKSITGPPSSSVFTIATSCGSLTNCLAWNDDDITDNCGAATTAFMALINGYSGPGAVQVYIQGSGAGKAFLLQTCNLAFTTPAAIHLWSTLDAGTNSGANLIQFGTVGLSGFVTTSVPPWRIDGGGMIVGGANLTVAGIEVEPYTQVTWIKDITFINFGAGNATLGLCTNYAIQYDGPNPEAAMDGVVIWNTDTVGGRCGINNGGAGGIGSNTGRFHNVRVLGNSYPSTPCGSVAMTEGGNATVISDGSLYGYGILVRVQGGAGGGGDGTTIENMNLDANGCKAANVSAAIQYGGHLSSTAIQRLNIIGNYLGGSTNEYLVAPAADSTANASYVNLAFNKGVPNYGMLIPYSSQAAMLNDVNTPYNLGFNPNITTYGFTVVENPLSNGGKFTAAGSGNAMPQVIGAGVVEPTATGVGQGAYYTGIAWPRDQKSTVTVLTANTGAIILCAVRQHASTNTRYQLNVSNAGSNNWQLYATVAGSSHLLHQFTDVAPASGHTISLQVTGTSPAVVKAFYDSTLKDTFSDSTYNGSIMNGSPGFQVFATTLITDAQISSWTGSTLP